MKFIDLHCDTAARMFYENLDLKDSICKVDIEKLKKGNAMGQVFAIFIDKSVNSDPYDELSKIYSKFIEEVKRNSGEIEIVTSVEQLVNANKQGKVGAFLSIEEGEVIKGKIENLKKVYDLGIRILTVTWNYKNKLGYPNCLDEYQKKGLTTKGIEVIEKCEELGIIPDASHLSDAGFYDLVNVCRKPFIASHSNARAVTNHSRNLSNDMIKRLAEKGGVMGLNFCRDFLGEVEMTSLKAIVLHAKHIKNIGGIDVLCLGSDFDGIPNEVEINNASEFYKLHDALKKSGFTEDEIEKVFYKNVLRVFKDTLK